MPTICTGVKLLPRRKMPASTDTTEAKLDIMLNFCKGMGETLGGGKEKTGFRIVISTLRSTDADNVKTPKDD